MDDRLKEVLHRFLHFKAGKQTQPKAYYPDVVDEPDYREDEIAFIVGLENGQISSMGDN